MIPQRKLPEKGRRKRRGEGRGGKGNGKKGRGCLPPPLLLLLPVLLEDLSFISRSLFVTKLFTHRPINDNILHQATVAKF